MPYDAAPNFRALDKAESQAILLRNHVGRIAYSFHDRVDIEPIHYVCDGGWIYGRTSPGTKLATLSHHRWVAFEVDEVDGPFDWRSVVVHGTVYWLTSDASHASPGDAETGLTLLRTFLPETLTERDPTPFRTVLFRLSTSEITGRCASTVAAPDATDGAETQVAAASERP
ncbi:MAG TPA: pyridoxamine 5'-phosphate oxidase family protein [Gemmatimonadaceae bacterium]|nr:pyridoxamine 5'-phosphate oxidase family protein [Gemmatimonadaceae bacterium]